MSRIPLRPDGLNAQQRREVQNFVAIALAQHEKKTAGFVEELLRQHFVQCVTFGLFTAEGIERVKAAQDASQAAQQAQGATEAPAPAPEHQSGLILVQ